MNKILLNNDAHIFQLLGAFNEKHGYALPKDIADILIKMPKKLVVSKDEINVGNDTAFFTADIENDKFEFFLENSILYLAEHAAEMGGIAAYTYLTPLTEISAEFFKAQDGAIDLAPLQTRIKQRREKQILLQAEHERLARSAMRHVRKMLAAYPLRQFSDLLKEGKRFIRYGKPDYNTAQLQALEYVIEKNNLIHPASEIIAQWKTSINNKTSAALLSELSGELHPEPQIIGTKNSGGGKSSTYDFNRLIAAILEQDLSVKPKVRLNPSKKAAELMAAEHEIEQPFEPEPASEVQETQESAPYEQMASDDKAKVQKLLSKLPEKLKPDEKQETAEKLMAPEIEKYEHEIRGNEKATSVLKSLQPDKKPDPLPQPEPEPWNPDREL